MGMHTFDLLLLKSDLVQSSLPGHRQDSNLITNGLGRHFYKLGFAFEQWVGPWKTFRHRSSMPGFGKNKVKHSFKGLGWAWGRRKGQPWAIGGTGESGIGLNWGIDGGIGEGGSDLLSLACETVFHYAALAGRNPHQRCLSPPVFWIGICHRAYIINCIRSGPYSTLQGRRLRSQMMCPHSS